MRLDTLEEFIWFYPLFTLSPFPFYRAHFSYYLANFYVRQTVKSHRTETKNTGYMAEIRLAEVEFFTHPSIKN